MSGRRRSPLGFLFRRNKGKRKGELSNSDYFNLDESTSPLLKQKFITMSPTIKSPMPYLIGSPCQSPSVDEKDGHINLTVDEILNHRYLAQGILGCGIYGKVIKAKDRVTSQHVAIKILKRQYSDQGMVEVRILNHMKKYRNPLVSDHISHLFAHFKYKGHVCLVFELLNISLFEFIKKNKFKGLSFNLMTLMSKQLLTAIQTMAHSRVIHCDLKPENVCLRNNISNATNLVKIVDYSSAQYSRSNNMIMYLQSRFYRAPEVIFGIEGCVDHPIDVWSFGCMAFELYWGLPLFPGVDQYDLVMKMVNMLGVPPKSMLEKGKYSYKFFKKVFVSEKSKTYIYRLKTKDEYYLDNGTKPEKYNGSNYLNRFKNIEQAIAKKKRKLDKNIKNVEERKRCFIDFVKGCLKWNPGERWKAKQALQHPFLSVGVFKKPWNPPKESKPIPIGNKENVNEMTPSTPSSVRNSFQSSYGSYDGFERSHSYSALFSTSGGESYDVSDSPVFSNSPLFSGVFNFGSYKGNSESQSLFSKSNFSTLFGKKEDDEDETDVKRGKGKEGKEGEKKDSGNESKKMKKKYIKSLVKVKMEKGKVKGKSKGKKKGKGKGKKNHQTIGKSFQKFTEEYKKRNPMINFPPPHPPQSNPQSFYTNPSVENFNIYNYHNYNYNVTVNQQPLHEYQKNHSKLFLPKDIQMQMQMQNKIFKKKAVQKEGDINKNIMINENK